MVIRRKLLLPIAALIFFTVLFCLPGSVLPKEDWLTKIYFDKWVHIGIFTVLLFLWCRALTVDTQRAVIFLVGIAILYGLLIELIQDRLVANRSWDMGDVVADFFGTIIGVLIWYWYKKINPCRNRGRNQN